MKSCFWRHARLGLACVSSFVFIVVFAARANSRDQEGAREPVPDDWSHHHLIFRQPSSAFEAARLQGEPRYWHQFYSRMNAFRRFSSSRASRIARKHAFRKDWAQSLNAGGLTGSSTYPAYPAKFTFDVNATPSCTNDYVAYPTNLVGSASTASIIAFNNLYSGSAPTTCGANPTVYWAYNTNAAGDTTGAVNTSPVISGDGTKIGFVETKSGGSVLHLLKFVAGDGAGVGAPVAPTHLLTSGSWNSCPVSGSCMISLTFGGTTDTDSSPFYDYGRDEMYVGDDNGVLHKFTGAFKGAPTEVTTGGWPITINSTPGTILTSPVLGIQSGNIFIGDSNGILHFVKETGSTTGSCLSGSPPCLGSASVAVATGGNAIIDSPVVDSGTGRVFAYVGNNGAGSPAANVVQADVALTPASVVRVNLGPSGVVLHIGAFDNTYLSSPSNGIAGYLYVCGKRAASDRPAIRRVGFNSSGVINSAADAGELVVGVLDGVQCSPVTESFDGATDRIFFSVQFWGNTANCFLLGCVMSVNLPAASPFTFPSAIANSIAESGGSSGIIIDNIGAGGQQSSLYFTRLQNSNIFNLCNGASGVGCAVKVTQSGLQ